MLVDITSKVDFCCDKCDGSQKNIRSLLYAKLMYEELNPRILRVTVI